MQDKVKEFAELIESGKVLLIRTDEALKNLTKEYNKVKDELKELGITPETQAEDIKKLEEEYNSKLKELSELIPVDIINKYKDYDFSAAIKEEEIDMDLAF